MKKLKLLALSLSILTVLPTFALDSASLKNLSFIGQENQIKDNINIEHISEGIIILFKNTNKDYIRNGFNITFLNNKWKKIDKFKYYNLEEPAPIDRFFPEDKEKIEYIDMKLSNIPPNTSAYKISVLRPKLDSSIYYKKLKKDFVNIYSSLNEALVMSRAMNEEIYDRQEYASQIFRNCLLPRLNVVETYGNGFLLANGTNISYNEVNNRCSNAPHELNATVLNSCAKITIDMNGVNTPPNLYSNQSQLNDSFSLLLYKDKILPEKNSVEYKLINSEYLPDMVAEELMSKYYQEYWNSTKNIEILDTRPYISVGICNDGNETKKGLLSIIFYDENKAEVYKIEETISFAPNSSASYECKNLDFKNIPESATSYFIKLTPSNN